MTSLVLVTSLSGVCHEFERSATEDPPFRDLMYVKSVEAVSPVVGVEWPFGEEVPTRASSFDRGSKFQDPSLSRVHVFIFLRTRHVNLPYICRDLDLSRQWTWNGEKRSAGPCIDSLFHLINSEFPVWCAVEVRKEMLFQMSSLSLDQGSKLQVPSPKVLE
ncbi:hypothetical protein TNCV_5112781 [Trichonephila clavipes]|nr:hypothetical protein TNCV_5112781 [Trichonephila clavipes]